MVPWLPGVLRAGAVGAAGVGGRGVLASGMVLIITFVDREAAHSDREFINQYCLHLSQRLGSAEFSPYALDKEMPAAEHPN